MEVFAKIVNSYSLHYFGKKLHLRFLKCFQITLCTYEVEICYTNSYFIGSLDGFIKRPWKFLVIDHLFHLDITSQIWCTATDETKEILEGLDQVNWTNRSLVFKHGIIIAPTDFTNDQNTMHSVIWSYIYTLKIKINITDNTWNVITFSIILQYYTGNVCENWRAEACTC